MIENASIDDCWNLRLRIYVLGYYREGESILIVLYNASSQVALKTILVDCYEKDGCNRIEDAMKDFSLKEKKLDYVIWTHPDRDHSVGFKTITSNYTLKDTLYILPEGLSFWEVLNDFDKFKSWIAITTNKMIGKMNVERVNTSNRRVSPPSYATNFIDGSHDDVLFSIEILTPFANQNFRHLEFNKTHKGNHLSISFIIRLGDLGFFFGGDVENMAIDSIDRNKLNNLYFVKIPHHGSDTSDTLPIILNDLKHEDESPAILSVTTGYHKGKSDLPLVEVLDLYKDSSFRILKTEDDLHTNGYGMWACNFDRTAGNPWSYIGNGDIQVYY